MVLLGGYSGFTGEGYCKKTLVKKTGHHYFLTTRGASLLFKTSFIADLTIEQNFFLFCHMHSHTCTKKSDFFLSAFNPLTK